MNEHETESKQFWNKRASKYGHTGWNNPLVYAYDQQVRLQTIRHMIIENHLSGTTLLDFGGGTGDFSVALGDLFSHIVLFDISDEVIKIARKRSIRNAVCTTDPSVIEAVDSYDMILSITVLQHILSDDELFSRLCAFRRSLTKNGRILVLESVENANNEQSGSNTHLRSYRHLLRLFQDAGLVMTGGMNFYHPIDHPVGRVGEFRENLFFRAIAHLPAGKARDSLLGHLAKGYLSQWDKYVAPLTESKGVKILIFADQSRQ